MGSIEISGLYVYPIKSCRGISLNEVSVERRGFARDRRWMVVDEDGRFITQRADPALTPVNVEAHDDGIVVSAPSRASMELPWALDAGERMPVTVWTSTVEALVHPSGSRWFSQLLGRPARLVFMPDDVERAIDPEYATPAEIVSFADGFPVLVVSEESLDDLSSRLPAPMEMERFRPNLVVRGGAPYAEDEWGRAAAGEVVLRMAKLCGRCVLVTRDPLSGRASKEPLKTLASYRKRDRKVRFGVNAIPERLGWLRLGDRVRVA